MKLLQHWKDELLELVNSKNQLALTEQDVTFEFVAKDDASDAVSVRIKPLEGSPYFNEQTLVFVRRDFTKNFVGIPLRFVVSADTTIGALVDQLAARFGLPVDKAVDFLEADLQTAVTFEDSGVKDLELNAAESSFVWAGKLSFTVANDTLDLGTIIEQADLTSLTYLSNVEGKGALSLATFGFDFTEEAGARFDDQGNLSFQGVLEVCNRLVTEGVISVADMNTITANYNESTPMAFTVTEESETALTSHAAISVETFDLTELAGPLALHFWLDVEPVVQDIVAGSGGVTIAPYGFKGTINWGDGNTSTFDNASYPVSHNYLGSGPFAITFENVEKDTDYIGNQRLAIAGNGLHEVNALPAFYNDLRELTFYESTNHIAAQNLVAVPAALPATVENINGMFRGAASFNQDISGWNTANVFNMSNTFNGAAAFNQNLSGWDVAKVTTHADFDTGATAWEAGNKPTFAA